MTSHPARSTGPAHLSDQSETGTPLRIPLGHDELVIRRRYEVVSIINDILIGLWFTIGSVLTETSQDF